MFALRVCMTTHDASLTLFSFRNNNSTSAISENHADIAPSGRFIKKWAKTVQFDADSQKIIGKESGTVAFPEDIPMNRLWMKKGADSESDSDSEIKISV